MRTIIAGSRTITDFTYLYVALDRCGWNPTAVLCGGAKGADQLGYNWALRENVPVELYNANWDKYGKAAGFIRNKEMADNAEALIALWDGYSKGTGNMIDIARKLGLKVYVELC